MARKTEGVRQLVQDVLETFSEPYGEDIIEDVCLAIEDHPEWMQRYRELSDELRSWVVNNWIGQVHQAADRPADSEGSRSQAEQDHHILYQARPAVSWGNLRKTQTSALPGCVVGEVNLMKSGWSRLYLMCALLALLSLSACRDSQAVSSSDVAGQNDVGRSNIRMWLVWGGISIAITALSGVLVRAYPDRARWALPLAIELSALCLTSSLDRWRGTSGHCEKPAGPFATYPVCWVLRRGLTTWLT